MLNATNQINQKELVLRFDLRTIEHLGIQMYKTLPPVLSELISNAYDADATCVNISFIDTEEDKQIIVSDNGCGMTFDEINQSFLVIGKNRRKDEAYAGNFSKGGRKVTGRKGLGKLAIFAITISSGEFNLKEGEIILMPKGEPHSLKAKTKFKIALFKV